MLHRRRRLAAGFLALSLLAATLYTVDSLASPSPAEARCTGEGSPVYSWYRYAGDLVASETPGAGTCNGNNIYSGGPEGRTPRWLLRVSPFQGTRYLLDSGPLRLWHHRPGGKGV